MPEKKFDEDTHQHSLDGKKIKGCTSILQIIAKPALIQWAADLATVASLNNPALTEKYELFSKMKYGDARDVAKKQLDKDFPEYAKARKEHIKRKNDAAKWGKIVHKAIEMWIKTKNVSTHVEIGKTNTELLPEHLVAVNNFVEWATQNDVEFIESETDIYSQEWEIGGIADIVCKYKGKLWVGDIKTSSMIDEGYFLQTAAYAKMLVEMGKYEHFDGLVVIQLDKKDGSITVEERKDIAGNIKCYEAAITLHNRLN